MSPATLYQFFPNKEALSSALASMYAREIAQAERAIDPEGVLDFAAAIHELIDVCMSFDRKRPEFHTLVVDAPLSDAGRKDKQALGQALVDFITDRLRRELPTLSRSEAAHHGRVARSCSRSCTMPSSATSIQCSHKRKTAPAPPKRSRSQKGRGMTCC